MADPLESMPLAAPFFLAFATSAACVPLCRLVALRLGLVARPREDRWHTRPIALFGGVGLAAGLFTAVAVYGGGFGSLRVLLLAASLTFALGLADDIWSFKPATKLVFEIGVASLFLVYGYRLNWVTSLTLDWLLTIVWVVGVTNAFNLLDNMDGLATGIGVIAGAAFLIGALPVDAASPAFFHVRYLVALLGALLGFLIYNVHPASIFLGDSGSLLIGMSFAGLTLSLGSALTGSRVITVVAVPVLVLLIPIFDTTLVTFSRFLSGRPASVGGRDHSSHRLVAIGLSERGAVALLWLLAAIGGTVGLTLSRAETWGGMLAVLFLTGMIIFAIYLGGIRVYEDTDQEALQGRGLTPLVFDFVYKQRVAEVCLDFVLVALSYYAAHRLRYDTDPFGANFPRFLQTLPLVLTTQLAAFYIVGVYRGVWSYFSLPDAIAVAKGAVAGMFVSGALVLYLYPAAWRDTRSIFIIYVALVLILVTASRASFQIIAESLQRQRHSGRRVIVYGAGAGGSLAVREMMQWPDRDLKIVGFIDDDVRKQRTRVHGYPVLGTRESLRALVLAGSVDAVVLSVRVMDAARLRALEALCAEHGIALLRLLVGIESLVGSEEALAGPLERTSQKTVS